MNDKRDEYNGIVYPQNSKWILPPDKAPGMVSSVLLLLLGFGLLIGSLVYNLLSILSGNPGNSFYIFIVLLILSSVIIMFGSVRFTKSYASRKYQKIMSRRLAAMRNMPVCPGCGRRVPPNVNYCPYCGTPIKRE